MSNRQCNSGAIEKAIPDRDCRSPIERQYLARPRETLIVDQQPAVGGRAGDVDVTVVPADVAMRIDAPGIKLLGRTVVDAADIERQGAVDRGEIVGGHPVKRAFLVDDVEQRPAQREHRMLAAVEYQFVIAPQRMAFDGLLETKQPKPRRRLRDRIVARIGDAEHQGRLALVHGDDRMLGKDKTRARPREPGKDQPGHDREEGHAGEDFDRGDEMPVIGLRVHVAVADRRQRLDREIEQARAASRARHWRSGRCRARYRNAKMALSRIKIAAAMAKNDGQWTVIER